PGAGPADRLRGPEPGPPGDRDRDPDRGGHLYARQLRRRSALYLPRSTDPAAMNGALTVHRPRRTAWLRSPALGLGSALLVAVGVVSVAAPLLTPYRPTDQRILDRLAPPSAAHWLGTDQYGRDVLTRTLFGSRT